MKTAKTMISSHRYAMIALALLFAFTVAANAQSANSPNGLAGTWRVVVQQNDCHGANVGGPFASMLSFHSGGTMSGTTSNPGFAAGQRTSDYGVWSYQGSQTYSAASEAYVLFNSANNFPFVRGTQRISQVITVNGDSFTSVAVVTFFDAAHNVYRSGCAVATATRFE